MIAIDASSLIAYWSGEKGGDVEAVDAALVHNQAVLPPVVLTELLSEPQLSPRPANLLKGLPLLEILDGFWERAGILRAKLLAIGKRAPLADTLIAQSCIDHQVPLITRDRDFRHFAPAGLELL